MAVDLKWFSKHDFSEYRGKYVAIIDKKVVAYGKNAKKVWKDAKKKFPEKSPAIAKIPNKETYVLIVNMVC